MAELSSDDIQKFYYMLFSLEAKLRIQQDLLVEIADILTDRNPGDIRNEIAVKTIKELKNISNQMAELKL